MYVCFHWQVDLHLLARFSFILAVPNWSRFPAFAEITLQGQKKVNIWNTNLYKPTQFISILLHINKKFCILSPRFRPTLMEHLEYISSVKIYTPRILWENIQRISISITEYLGYVCVTWETCLLQILPALRELFSSVLLNPGQVIGLPMS